MDKKIFVIIGVALLALSMFVGCQASETNQSKIDSGVIDEDYIGNTDPTVPKEWKLTEEEKKNGVEKVIIQADDVAGQENSNGQANDTEAAQEQTEENSGGGLHAKPNI